MDPFTAVCNMITAYITFATARYNGASATDKATLSAIDAAIIKDMYDLATKVHGDVGGGMDKLKAAMSRSTQ